MKWAPLFSLPFLLVGWVSADTQKGKIAYARKSGEGYRIHVMNADGTGDREVPGQSAAVNVFPTWSPDGKRLAVMTAESPEANSHQVCILSLDGSPAKTIQSDSTRAGLATWSPDGKRLAFSAGNELPRLWVADADGGGARQVTGDGEGGFGAFWLDNSRIGYTRFQREERRSGLVVRNLETGAVDELLPAGEEMQIAGPNAVSRDGKKLLFLNFKPQEKKLTLRSWNLADKVENTLVEYPAVDNLKFSNVPLAAWTPDGKGILATMIEGENSSSVQLLDESGMKIRQLSPAGVPCAGAAWHPGE